MTAQRTVKETVSVKGRGLHTGKPVTLTVKGAPVDSGIIFVRTDINGCPSLELRSLDITGAAASGGARRTQIRGKAFCINTTEHLLAALFALGVDNAMVLLDNDELPALDGSAAQFADLIKKAGIVELDKPKRPLKVDRRLRVAQGDRYIEIVPGKGLSISYTMSYPDRALGTQALEIQLTEHNFVSQIAPARTFCLRTEALLLRLFGFGKGADYSNTLVMTKDGPVGNKLRFPDEPVRHKILDLVGDLGLLGLQIEGKIKAYKSGHALNMELVRRLKELI